MDQIANTQIRDAMRAAAKAWKVFDNGGNYSFHEYRNSAIARYDEQCGYDVVLVFINDSLLIKGFDNEAPESQLYTPGDQAFHPVFNYVPDYFIAEIQRPEVENQYVSLLHWRENETGKFNKQSFDLPPGIAGSSDWLLERIITSFGEFVEHASDYLQDEFTPDIKSQVTQIFESEVTVLPDSDPSPETLLKHGWSIEMPKGWSRQSGDSKIISFASSDESQRIDLTISEDSSVTGGADSIGSRDKAMKVLFEMDDCSWNIESEHESISTTPTVAGFDAYDDNRCYRIIHNSYFDSGVLLSVTFHDFNCDDPDEISKVISKMFDSVMPSS